MTDSDLIRQITDHVAKYEDLSDGERAVAISWSLELAKDEDSFDQFDDWIDPTEAAIEHFTSDLPTVEPPPGHQFFGIVDADGRYRWVTCPVMEMSNG